ncbi:hypothetical protein ACFY7N_30635 [Streptomyces albidoflavus]
MTRRHLQRLERLAPRIDDLSVWLTERRGDQLAEVITRSLDALRDETTALLRTEGQQDLADHVAREWPGWAARIVPEQIAAVTGTDVGAPRP